MTTLSHLKKGFSLVELLLALGVIAVFLIASFVVYPRVKSQQQAQQESANIRAIQVNLRNLFYSLSGNYAKLGGEPSASNPSIANQARVFPSIMNGGDYSKSAPIRSIWGGEVYVWTRPALSTPKGDIAHNKSFGIAYKDVPKSVCVPLVSSNYESFHSVLVGEWTKQKEVILPENGLDIPTLTALCQDDNLTITFTSV